MRVGIVGSGLMGGKLGTLFARAGHDVVFSYARTEGKLAALAAEAGAAASAGTVAEAVRDADAVLLGVHWSRLDDVLGQAGDLTGKAIITCCLPMGRDADSRRGLRANRRRAAADRSVHGAVHAAGRSIGV